MMLDYDKNSHYDQASLKITAKINVFYIWTLLTMYKSNISITVVE